MKTPSFKPLHGAKYLNNNVFPSVPGDFERLGTDKTLVNHELNGLVPVVPSVPVEKHIQVIQHDAHPAGVGLAKGDSFRSPVYQDITHEAAGMVQCGKCGHVQGLGESEPSGAAVGRCRHPEQHGGRWPVLASDVWRRCGGYHKKERGRQYSHVP